MRLNICFILMLLAILDCVTMASADLWCYCTQCEQGLRYCRTNENSACYRRAISPSFLDYGCSHPHENIANCTYGPMPSFAYSKGNRINKAFCCRGSNWCNVEPSILTMTKNDRKLSCYCNHCDGPKSCLTDGMCVVDRSRHIDTPDYGCMSQNTSVTLCQQYYDKQIPNISCDSAVLCCGGQTWCNFPQNNSNESLDGKGEIELRTIRLERFINNNSKLSYKIIGRNRLSGELKMTLKNVVADIVFDIAITKDVFYLEPQINSLYEITLVPILKDYQLYSYAKSFFLTRVLMYTGNWFPGLTLSTQTSKIVICKLCYILSDREPRCHQCTNFVDPLITPFGFPCLPRVIQLSDDTKYSP